ncbi:MAG: hypothetical protein NWT04_09525 [Verrucomicrobiales bacterium]|nr:hypothetical protein [Verrucomicrobiales bacterium]
MRLLFCLSIFLLPIAGIALETPQIHEDALLLVGPGPNVVEITLIRNWITEGAE